MSTLENIDKSLENLFKNAPKLPNNGKKFIVKYAPILSLILGIITLLGAWSLWHWAHAANQLINNINSINQLYGNNIASVPIQRMSTLIWVTILISGIIAVLYLMSYAPLKAHKKSGWNLLFYIALINIVSGFISIFIDYGGGIFSFIEYLIGSAIGLYFLYQIKDMYKETHTSKK